MRNDGQKQQERVEKGDAYVTRQTVSLFFFSSFMSHTSSQNKEPSGKEQEDDGIRLPSRQEDENKDPCNFLSPAPRAPTSMTDKNCCSFITGLGVRRGRNPTTTTLQDEEEMFSRQKKPLSVSNANQRSWEEKRGRIKRRESMHNVLDMMQLKRMYFE